MVTEPIAQAHLRRTYRRSAESGSLVNGREVTDWREERLGLHESVADVAEPLSESTRR